MLTLDREIQFVAQQILLQAVADTNAEAGTVVIIDVESGEVLAMATAPTFDPNDRSRAAPNAYRNRAVTDAMAPPNGSCCISCARLSTSFSPSPSNSSTVPCPTIESLRSGWPAPQRSRRM